MFFFGADAEPHGRARPLKNTGVRLATRLYGPEVNELHIGKYDLSLDSVGVVPQRPRRFCGWVT